MDESHDPTAILNSLKDLNKFLASDRSVDKIHDSLRNGIGASPRLKLDFLDTTGLWQDSSLHSEFETSSGSSFIKKHQQNIAGFDITKKLREKDSQILEGRTTIALLQSKLQNAQTTHKESRIHHDAEIESFIKKQSREKEMIEELEQKVKQMQNKEREAKEETLRIKKLSEANCSQLEKKMLQLQTTSLEKSDQLHEELSKLRSRVTHLEKEEEEKSSSLHLQELQNKDLEERVATLHKKLITSERTQLELETLKLKLTQANSEKREFQLRLENLKGQESHYQLFENTIKQLPVLQKQLMKLKEENSMHKITRVNVGLLEEKLSAAENRLKAYEERCNDLTAENATLVTLRDLSEQYEVALKKELDLEYLPPVSDLVGILQEMKKKDDVVTHSLTELKASLESHSNFKDIQEDLVKSLKAEGEKNRLELVKNAQIIRRLQRKVFLLSKERDNLKDIISSYESESTLNPSSLEQERISHLESQLSSYKAEVSKLEGELNEAQQMEKFELKSSQVDKSGKVSKSEDKIQELEKMVAQLAEENDTLKSQLEHHGIKASYDPSQTKILHFTNNPLEMAYQERKAEYDKLSQENETLKKRVKLLEEGDTLNLTQKVGAKVNTDGVSSKQAQELEEKVNSLETRNKRLIDAFKLKSQQMREVVYRLTGYRVDLRGDNHYRLSNMYSESQEDYLLFEETPSGDLQLMETEFSGTLENLIDSYLHHDHSYPAFLSALTLNLFGRQTMNHSSSEQEEEDFEGGEDDEDDEDEDEMGEEEEEEDIGEDEDEEEEDDEEEEEDEEEGERPSKRIRRDDDDDNELICLD